jgi:hypothetical protein
MSILSWIVLVVGFLGMVLLQQIVNRLTEVARELREIQSQIVEIINTLDREFPRIIEGRRMEPFPRIPHPPLDK